jgi:hypothetical protein
LLRCMSQLLGTSRQFAATQQFGRFRSEADITEPLFRTGFMSTRPSVMGW